MPKTPDKKIAKDTAPGLVRRLAVEAFIETLTVGTKPRDIIDRVSAKLMGRDRGFLMELLYGMLRTRDRLDWLMRDYLKKPGALGNFTINNLRLGAYQLFYTRVPEWAVANESVNMQLKNRALVNAVLRNLIRDKAALNEKLRLLERTAEDTSMQGHQRTAAIATLTSHPAWLIRRWAKRLGYEEAYALAKANNEHPPLILRVNTMRVTRQSVIRKLRQAEISARLTKFSPDGIRVGGGAAYKDLPPSVRATVLAQDEAAQLVSFILGPQPGERVLDACSAPGGKATHMAQMMRDEGEVVAVERDPRRIGTLKENIAALGLKSIKIITADLNEAAGELKAGGLFDRVLLDAPCSALGTIRRNPDVRYRHSAADLKAFRATQVRLMRTGASLLKPGGTMLYSTCSTEPEEGEEAVREFLKSFKHCIIIEEVPQVKEIPDIGDFFEGGFFRTWPHKHGMDGFFCARLMKQ